MFRTALILMTSILDSFILSQDKLLPASASPVLELKVSATTNRLQFTSYSHCITENIFLLSLSIKEMRLVTQEIQKPVELHKVFIAYSILVMGFLVKFQKTEDLWLRRKGRKQLTVRLAKA